MTDQQLVERAQAHMRLALPLMSKHKIPITPQYYNIWYQYVSGENSELKNSIDDILKANTPFTIELNEALYHKYCTGTHEGEVKRLRKDLQTMLISVMVEFADMTGKTENYNTVLTDSVSKLSEDISIETFKDILDEIIGETKSINSHTTQIQQKLQKTTNELESLKQAFIQTKREASIDFLTGVANRKAFKEVMDVMAGNADSNSKRLCLLVIDIDHFKKFNDDHGHLVGDEVLKFVAKKIKTNVRGKDFVARYGGEEFVVLLPMTPLAGAAVVAENIRDFFAKSALKIATKSKTLGHITASIGAAEFRPGEDLADFVERADKALYHAKNNGRNKVTTEKDI